MTLSDFHRNFRSDVQTVINERVEAGEGPFPSDELVFAELVMRHMEDAGLCEPATVCHWSGTIGNAKLRITGYALSADETGLDLFVTHYFGTDELVELKDSDAIATANEGVRFLFRASREVWMPGSIQPTPFESLLRRLGRVGQSLTGCV